MLGFGAGEELVCFVATADAVSLEAGGIVVGLDVAGERKVGFWASTDLGVGGEYMRTKSSPICDRVASVNLIWRSTRPGRMSASSSFSGKLVVMTSTRPSWDATPSMALRRPLREMCPEEFVAALECGSCARASGVAPGGRAMLLMRFVSGLGFSAAGFGLRVMIPALSMSSSRTTQRRGSLSKRDVRSSSEMEASCSEIQ